MGTLLISKTEARWLRSDATPFWTQGSTSTGYFVNNLNQYTLISGSAPPTWNTDGGLHTYAGNTYVYDALQRLTEVDYLGGKTLFRYDPLGRRIKKIDEDGTGATVLATYEYHYDGSEVAVEYQPSTTWTYGLGLGLDQVVLRQSTSATQWYYRDGHGSTSAVADNSGNTLEDYEYNAQGQFQIINPSGTPQTSTQIGNDLLYTGRNFDYETGNYFYRARYYNPELGRFISRDPLSGAEFSQGTNLYAYVGNNPINSIDPLGKSALSNGLAIGGIVVLGIAATISTGGLAGPVAALAIAAAVGGTISGVTTGDVSTGAAAGLAGAGAGLAATALGGGAIATGAASGFASGAVGNGLGSYSKCGPASTAAGKAAIGAGAGLIGGGVGGSLAGNLGASGVGGNQIASGLGSALGSSLNSAGDGIMDGLTGLQNWANGYNQGVQNQMNQIGQ